MDYITLNNGVKMPQLGYGVYQTPVEETEACVSEAIKVGYRSIDTAQIYGNEEGVGNAIAKSGLPREEFFITTKIWFTNAGYEKAKASIEESLKKLKTDYIDLLLIHQPIGVSNFYPDRLIDLEHFVEIKPAVNQVELHVFQQQKEANEYMKARNCQIMSWGPFAEGKNDYFNNPVLKEVSQKHGKTTAQVALRFLLQSGVVLIPKSTHRNRMEENFDIFNFTLDDEDMKKIEDLDTGKSLFFSHYDPKMVEWFMSMA